MSDITEKHLENWAAGKVELRELIELDDSTMQTLRGRAQFFLDGGHKERALIMLEMLEELDRTDPLPTLLAIDVLLEQGRSDAAEQKIERLLASDPKDPQALVAKAELLIHTGQLVPAAQLLERVVKEHPKSDSARRALAVAKRAHARQ